MLYEGGFIGTFVIVVVLGFRFMGELIIGAGRDVGWTSVSMFPNWTE